MTLNQNFYRREPLNNALQRHDRLLGNHPDKIISHDPVAALDRFLDAHPAWKQADAHVYWKQDGWKLLEMKDYMVSSVQVSFSLISL